MSDSQGLIVLSVAVALRLWLTQLPEISTWLISRPEISTPISSWNRLIEGDAISSAEVNADLKDSYHGSTLMRVLMSGLNSQFPFAAETAFIAADVITALSLFLFSKKYLQGELHVQTFSKQKLAKGISDILIKPEAVSQIPTVVFTFYLLNPFTIATCIAKSSVVFNNMFLALFLLSSVSGSLIQMTLFLSLATYETLYPMQLIVAATLLLQRYQDSDQSLFVCAAKCILLMVGWLFTLFLIAYLFDSSMSSLFSHYRFMLLVPDQTPNVGVFWYFFTEVFDHFQAFFLCVFQINVVVFSVPMAFKFRSHPVFLAFLLIAVNSIFKSYPSVGDSALWLCLLPLWSQTYSYLRYPSVTWVLLLTSTVLCPTMWHMWIVAHSANANFYFAATLAYTTALVLITTDTALAYLNWHLRIREGLHPCMPGTKEKALFRLLN